MIDISEEETLSDKVNVLWKYTTVGKLTERDHRCSLILKDESIPYDVKHKYSQMLLMLSSAAQWGYTHFSGKELENLIRYNPPKQKNIKSILSNKSLISADLIHLFIKHYNDTIPTAKIKTMILDKLPDTLLVEATPVLWEARKKLSINDKVLFNRLKSAHQMDDVPDEWFEAVLSA